MHNLLLCWTFFNTDRYQAAQSNKLDEADD